jgi:hypothetical protein
MRVVHWVPLDATIARTKQMGNTIVIPVSSPESREHPSDDLDEAYCCGYTKRVYQ